MNFLEAHKIVKSFRGGQALPFLLACSGIADALMLFVRAHAAKIERDAVPELLPFNTLGQHLLGALRPDSREVYVLLPWDLLPLSNWRTGVPAQMADFDFALAAATQQHALLSRRTNARFIYVAAPLPPSFVSEAVANAVERLLIGMASSLGADILPAEHFSLGNYLSTGSPFDTQCLPQVAQKIVAAAASAPKSSRKVLITDLDNTLWSGIIGEDGLDGIAYRPEGKGFRHFIYQTLLKRLRQDGILLAAVSRNDEELALAPFRRGDMTLQEKDFVAIRASYRSKSAQIESLAVELNLGLDAFVFVDDNPIEIQEVGQSLPQVECVAVPRDAGELPVFLRLLAALFERSEITDEDRRRTEMYRLRAQSLTPDSHRGADLHGFLAGLEMSLVIHRRSLSDYSRCLQLINKTNQFNINGKRLEESELQRQLEDGATLLGVSLAEKAGSHGEVLACLIGPTGIVESFVMSCRVFQRRVEHAFMHWLSQQEFSPTGMRFVPTARNEPVQLFLRDYFGGAQEGVIVIDRTSVQEKFASDAKIFRISNVP